MGTYLTGLVGNTVGEYGTVRLTAKGRFGNAAWSHVGAVALLDYIPGGDRQTYACTVLESPWCGAGAAIERAWLPRARILGLEDDRLRWYPAAPSEASEIPSGTYVPESMRGGARTRSGAGIGEID